jgi:pimeloyl-ACP methyl ester carboxylesterase
VTENFTAMASYPMKTSWTWLTAFVLTARGLAAQAVPGPETVWEGVMKVGAGLELRIVLHVVSSDEGPPRATFDSPDQGAKGLKVDTITLKPESLTFTMRALAAEFTGKLNADGNEAQGQWTQGGASLPLTLRKTGKPSVRRRPQTPRPPYPYREVPLTYENKAANVRLAGTLTVPPGAGPFPAALLISGSGAQDRDETILEHKPFLVLADDLTRRGIAVLRVDDRGVGGSSGAPASSTSEDFAGDVLAGIATLKSRSDINPRAIGLIGHSEGGVIAPLVAARSNDVAFIVLLAASVLPGDEILVSQVDMLLKAAGNDEKSRERSVRLERRLLDAVKSEKDDRKAMEQMQSILRETRDQLPEKERGEFDQSKRVIDAQLAQLSTPWFRFFLTYDPRPTLAQVRCPVLALNGSNDLQVAPRENLAAVEKALQSGGNRHVTTQELPRLNHLFQTSHTGQPAEYAQIEETLAPAVLRLIGDWIAEQVGHPN